MSILDAMARREVRSDAIARDHILVQRLESLLPDEFETVQVVCYFRRPDRYAESLYSQHVKRGISFAGTFNEFLPIVKPALFYHRHIRVWSEVFGTDSIGVRLYEPASADIVSDFGKNVLNIESTAAFHQATACE